MQDLKFVGGSFGTLLLRAGVMRALEEEEEEGEGEEEQQGAAKAKADGAGAASASASAPGESAVFSEDRIFTWAKNEEERKEAEVIIRNGGGGAGRSSSSSSSDPEASSPSGSKPGEWRARRSFLRGHVNSGFFFFSLGARYTEAELQQALATARREHREEEERMRKEQDEAMFKLRGERALLDEHYYVETIQRLEEEVRLLRRGSQRSLLSAAEEDAGERRKKQQPESPSKLEARSVCRAVEGRVSEVVSQEVPDTFVEYVPKGVHKGIQVDLGGAPSSGGEGARMVTKGIQVSRLKKKKKKIASFTNKNM